MRFGGIPARIGSGQERFDCIGVGGLVDHGVDIDGYAVSVAEADGDGNTVNDGVAADTGFAECTNRADPADHFRAGNSAPLLRQPRLMQQGRRQWPTTVHAGVAAETPPCP